MQTEIIDESRSYFAYSDDTPYIDENISFTAENIQDYSYPGVVNGRSPLLPNFLTFGLNQFKLIEGETRSLFSTNLYENMQIISKIPTDENGDFENDVVIKAIFGTEKLGFTISVVQFYTNVIFKDFDFEAYDPEGNLILTEHRIEVNEEDFENGMATCTLPLDCENCNSFILRIKSLKNPYAYLTVSKVNVGRYAIIEKDRIIECEINNALSLTGDNIEIGTLDITLDERKSSFNIKRNRVFVYNYFDKIKNGYSARIYYVNRIEEMKGRVHKIYAYDMFSILDKSFLGARWSKASLTEVIQYVLKDRSQNQDIIYQGLVPFKFDEDLNTDLLFTGIIPPGTVRQALTKVLNSAKLTCYIYNNILTITKVNNIADYELSDNEVSIDLGIEKGDKFKAINFKQHTYTKSKDTTKIGENISFSSKKSTRTLYSNSPVYSYYATKAGTDERYKNITIVNSHPYYVKIKCTNSVSLDIYAYQSVDTIDKFEVKDRSITGGDDMELDLQIINLIGIDDPQYQYKPLLDLYNRTDVYTFSSYVLLSVGTNVTIRYRDFYGIIKVKKLTITKTKSELKGLYEYEAQ